MKGSRFERIVVVGAGAWGQALAKVLQDGGHKTEFIDIETPHETQRQLLQRRSLVLITTPFSAVHEVLVRLKSVKIAGVVNASKGIDHDSLKTFSGMAKKILKVPFATLSGPTFAKEVLEGRPTACVIAGKSKTFISQVAKTFSTKSFRVYTSNDPIGVEVCGALKNVLAIACGISDGAECGLNARAALLARGLKEMEYLVHHFGGKTQTVYGLAGVGDLWLTATGDLSRNRRYGLLLAKGHSPDKAKAEIGAPVEGLYTVAQIHELSQKIRHELPICEQVFKIATGGATPSDALHALMTRDLKAEHV